MGYENEIPTFIRIWSTALLTLIFCHQIAARIPAGAARLLSLLPVFYLFTTLPFRLSSFHLTLNAVLNLVWLANIRLFRFAFDLLPLRTSPSLPPLHFAALAALPIHKITVHKKSAPVHRQSLLLFFPKFLLLTLVVKSYDYRDLIDYFNLIVPLYCLHLYLLLELSMIVAAAVARALLGLDVDPPFNEPYLSSSLQEFWGRRWNLVVSGTLRFSVYLPARKISMRVIGKRWAYAPAMVTTFAVSGLLHELMYYYVTRVSPTWEVTWFMVVNGVFVTAEVEIKRAATGRWRLPWVASCLVTLGFVMVTAGWLFFPQLIRSGLDLKAIDEYRIFVRALGGGKSFL